MKRHLLAPLTKMDRPGSRPSRSSLLGLDTLNFLMADVRDGVGPYLSIYLKGGLHWQPGEIGIAMAVSSITAAICQIPAGLLVDSVRAKRLLVGSRLGIAQRRRTKDHLSRSLCHPSHPRDPLYADR